mmetsp:Transcript_11895/g.12785  ORF Transcript_11895/g.12785 Transcript_11895/m.12785 type:complete len:91 (-) Transcript_11895:223-495(-)
MIIANIEDTRQELHAYASAGVGVGNRNNKYDNMGNSFHNNNINNNNSHHQVHGNDNNNHMGRHTFLRFQRSRPTTIIITITTKKKGETED